MKRNALVALALVFLLSLSVLTAAAQTNDNIVDIAAKNRNFDTVHRAIVAAGMADMLASADAQYTVFAPTDNAFSNFGEANPAALAATLDDPQGALTTVLKYHVVAGKYSLDELVEAGKVTTLLGEELTITTRNDRVFVNNARVLTADIPAKNGVIHAINNVLLPESIAGMVAALAPAETAATTTTAANTTAATTGAATAAAAPSDNAALNTIAEITAAAGNFDTLIGLLKATGLDKTLATADRFTVFAPTDEAFAALGDGTWTEAQLESIVRYHVVTDRLTRDQLATDDLVPTLSAGHPLFIHRNGAQIVDISGAKVLMYDIPAGNGIIHVIDRVMIP